ncbi:creatininase family protein [Microbacterium sediminicola]|uniref:Creatininase family protein n=1 Tax=Microbacterium sediminicola TaxID=415210 RepID=A0ABP4ULX5_9MICO
MSEITTDEGRRARAFATLPFTEIEKRITADSLLVVPVGAIEQHGAHLPLNTDAVVSEEVAAAAVARAVDAGVDAWLLPPLQITKSDEHDWSAGTLWLSESTMMQTLIDLGRSVTATAARTLVFVNGHGGNVGPLAVACRELRRRFGLRTFAMPAALRAPAPWTDAAGTVHGGQENGMDIHAGFCETSVMMHLRPDLVDAGAFARNVPDWLAEFDDIRFNGGFVSFGWTSDDFGPSGVIGDPTGATAAAGAEIFAGSVAKVAGALAQIQRAAAHLPLR